MSVASAGFTMRSNASPRIVALRTGGAQIALTANTGFLWTLGTDGGAHATAVDVQPNTNPAITLSQ
jgi:hypothetical protein